MKAWKLKGCPRCSGDIFLETDEEHRLYEGCLQCGYMRELRQLDGLTAHADEAVKKPVLASGLQRHTHT